MFQTTGASTQAVMLDCNYNRINEAVHTMKLFENLEQTSEPPSLSSSTQERIPLAIEDLLYIKLSVTKKWPENWSRLLELLW